MVNAPPARRDLKAPTDWVAYAFVALFTVPFLIFNVAPILFTAYLSFMKWGIFGPPRYVGLSNYRDAFENDQVRIAFVNILFYGLTIVPGVLVLGLMAALYVHNRWPLSSFARVCFFSPYVVSATVIGLVWVWLLDTRFGLINHYLAYLGFDYIPWLTNTSWALYGVSIASIWWDMGLAFVLILAALQDIPGDLYDAVEVDGAIALAALLVCDLADAQADSQHGHNAAIDLDLAHLQPSLCHDQRRTCVFVDIGAL